MRKVKQILIAAFICGLALSFAIPALAGSTAGSVEDPFAAKSYVDNLVERRFSAMEAEVARLTKLVKTQHNTTNITLKIGSTTASINGTSKTLAAAPIIAGSGYTLVPIRFVAESLNVNVEWLAETRQVKFYDKDTTVLLTIGSTTAYINDKAFTMNCAPVIDTKYSIGCTLVHVRFVSEAFGCSLDWSPKDDRCEYVYITR